MGRRYALLVSGERKSVARHVKFLLAVILATGLLASCGGQDTPVEQAEEAAGVEEIVEEETTETTTPYQAPPRDAEEAAADEAKAKAAKEGVKANRPGAAVEDFDPITELLACQSSEVGVELSPQEADALGNEMLEAVTAKTAPNFQTFLAERGYTCGGRAEKILAMTPDERMRIPSEEKIELSEERQRMEAEERSKMRQE